MRVRRYEEVAPEPVEQGAQHTTVRWLIAEKEGAPNFAMRLFEIGPNGHTPQHTHAWEHEVFVLDGEGAVVSAQRAHPISKGSVVFIPGNELHQFKNTGSEPLRMLCMVPNDRA